MVDVAKLKALREETGISLADIKKALEESGDDTEKAPYMALFLCLLILNIP